VSKRSANNQQGRECNSASSRDAGEARLEAIEALSHGASAAEAARVVGVASRSVQRWSSKFKELGPAGLAGAVWPGKTARLAPESITLLTADLRRDPTELGYRQGRWSAPLLSRHIRRRFGTIIGERQCLRVLRKLSGSACEAGQPGHSCPTRKASTKCDSKIDSRALEVPSSSLRPFSDRQLKQRALQRIQRLASAGLPLQPFAMTLFDLMSDAIPQVDGVKGICVDVHSYGWLFRDFDYLKWGPIVKKYVMEDDPAESGIIPQAGRDPGRTTVLRFEEQAVPEFHKLEGYNEFQRHIGAHHFISALLGQGDALGIYPLWRNESMKPFSADDLHFFGLAAHHITHGVKSARLLSSKSLSNEIEVPADVALGVVLMDFSGRVIAMNRVAERQFHQIAVFDGLRVDDFNRRLELALDYVTRTVRAVFGSGGECWENRVPVARVYSHWTGVTLTLRGFVTDRSFEKKYFTVLVEERELEQHRQQRLMLRHGLSRREAELLLLLAAGLATRQISDRMAIGVGTIKTYSARLVDKLGLENPAALRTFAREHQN
jgi:DNA-binding CsgD family transcriptional regulator